MSKGIFISLSKSLKSLQSIVQFISLGSTSWNGEVSGGSEGKLLCHFVWNFEKNNTFLSWTYFLNLSKLQFNLNKLLILWV